MYSGYVYDLKISYCDFLYQTCLLATQKYIFQEILAYRQNNVPKSTWKSYLPPVSVTLLCILRPVLQENGNCKKMVGRFQPCALFNFVKTVIFWAEIFAIFYRPIIQNFIKTYCLILASNNIWWPIIKDSGVKTLFF